MNQLNIGENPALSNALRRATPLSVQNMLESDNPVLQEIIRITLPFVSTHQANQFRTVNKAWRLAVDNCINSHSGFRVKLSTPERLSDDEDPFVFAERVETELAEIRTTTQV